MTYSLEDQQQLYDRIKSFNFPKESIPRYLNDSNFENRTNVLMLKLNEVLPAKNEPLLIVGSGKGSLSVLLSQEGYLVDNVEYNPGNVEILKWKYEKLGFTGEVTHSAIEEHSTGKKYKLILLVEVIEHVIDPERTLRKIHSLLSPGGKCYVTVPNRFHLRDPHFKMPLINFMPTRWADFLLQKLGRLNKGKNSGKQSLTEMHYFTYGGFEAFAKKCGFSIIDIRSREIMDPQRYNPRPNSRYDKIIKLAKMFKCSRILALVFRWFFGHRVFLQKN